MREHAQKMMPASRLGRLIVGVILVIGGVLGFLPVVGFWMIPLGLIVLSVDFPLIRRLRRRLEVRIGRWWRSRQAQKALKAAPKAGEAEEDSITNHATNLSDDNSKQDQK